MTEVRPTNPRIRRCAHPVDGQRCGDDPIAYFLQGWRCAPHTPRRLRGLPELELTRCLKGWCLCGACPPPVLPSALGHLPKMACAVCLEPMAVLSEGQDRHVLCEAPSPLRPDDHIARCLADAATTFETLTAEPDAGWLVIASICDCNKVAITIRDTWAPGTDAADPGEMTAVGPDWRALVPHLARELHTVTGRPISGMCSAVYTRNPDQKTALVDELTRLVYATGDAFNN